MAETLTAAQQAPPDAPPHTRVDVDLNGPFSLDEIVEVERLSGVPVGQWGAADVPQGEVWRAITYVVVRRSDATFTLSDAGQAMREV